MTGAETEKRDTIHEETCLLACFGGALGVRCIFHDLFNPAVKNPAKHINGMGADALIALQARDLAGADAVGVYQRVLCDALAAHGFPKPAVCDHAQLPSFI